jgi:GNAT superfamily N-acetyltransferase
MRRIKKASLEDIPVIQQLTYTIWPDAYKGILNATQLKYMLDLFYSDYALEKLMETSQYQFIIAYDDGEPTGFAAYSPKMPGDILVFRLHKLYVLPAQQGKGTGRFLLDYLIDEIIPRGATLLELNVNRYNKAQYFYHNMGFAITGEEDIDIGNGYFMNDYVMEKPLVDHS